MCGLSTLPSAVYLLRSRDLLLITMPRPDFGLLQNQVNQSVELPCIPFACTKEQGFHARMACSSTPPKHCLRGNPAMPKMVRYRLRVLANDSTMTTDSLYPTTSRPSTCFAKDKSGGAEGSWTRCYARHVIVRCTNEHRSSLLVHPQSSPTVAILSHAVPDFMRQKPRHG